MCVMPIGLTMAPRPSEPDVHDRCFASMARAGFPEVWAFAEPGAYSAWPKSAQVYKHSKRFGEWRNFIFCVRTLLRSYPSAERLMTCQDDIVWSRNAAAFAASQDWPSDHCGVIHVYTSRKYARQLRGLSRLTPVLARRMAGACGLVFRRAAAELLIQHADTKSWRGHTRDTILEPDKMEGVDTFIGEVLTDAGWEIWVNNPSRGQHIAKDSTLGHGGPHGSRVAANWQGEEVDAFNLRGS